MVSINWMKVDMTNMSLDDSNHFANTGNDSLVQAMTGRLLHWILIDNKKLLGMIPLRLRDFTRVE